MSCIYLIRVLSICRGLTRRYLLTYCMSFRLRLNKYLPMLRNYSMKLKRYKNNRIKNKKKL
jgi:hypothetical protein